MDVAATADEVIRRLRAFKNRERHAATQNYFPSAQEILGVYASDMRGIVRDIKQRTKHEDGKAVYRLALAIIRRNTLEGRQAAYEILAAHKQAMAALDLRQLEALGKGIDNWASVDGFACGLSGVAWRKGQISDADIKRWARSPDPWWRRAGVVSTVPLNLKSRGGTGDSKRTLMICELAVGDEHLMVHKALSWALRQLAGFDARSVREFLGQHDSKLPSLVKREVTRKLTTGKKNR